MISFGPVPVNSVLPIMFGSYDGATGASEALTGLVVGDILIYKGTSMTQRASTNGFVLLDTDGIDIDAITGINGFSIDLSDNSDAGFYAAGSFYTVVISSVTIDAQTVNFVAATFRIVAAENTSGTPVVDVGRVAGTAQTAGDILGDTNDIQSRLPAALVSGRMDSHIGSVADAVLTAAKFAAGAFDAVWSVAARLLTAGTNIVLAKGVGVTGFNDLDAAGVRSAVGLAAANLDTQLDALPTAAENADAVWDEALAGHVGVGSAGEAQNSIDDILTDTAVIGAAGAGLTAVPWNPAWDAEVQSEVDDALVVQRLDELLSADSDIDGLAPPTVGSVFHELLTKTPGSFTYDQTTDSLEAVRDNMGTPQTGDSFARLGAPAGASIAADIATRASQASLDTLDDYVDTEVAAIKAKTDNLPASPAAVGDIPTVAQIADGVWDEALAGHVGVGSAGEAQNSIDDILADTAVIGAAGAGLSAVPWNPAWDVEVQSEVADALDVAIPGVPTPNSINERIKAIDDKLPAGTISDFDESLDDVSVFNLTSAAVGDILREALANHDAGLAFRTLGGAVSKLVNRIRAAAGTLTIYKTDDVTSLGTQAITTDAAAAPIVELNTT